MAHKSVQEEPNMRKILREEILAEIWKARGEMMLAFMTKGEISCPYTFDNFSKDMLRAELVSDKRTIQTKWEMLIASGVIRETGGKPYRGGELSFVPFRSRMTASAEDMLDDLVLKHRQNATYSRDCVGGRA